MKVKCLIVDDEPLAINVIKNHIKSFTDFEVVSTCEDAMEAFHLLKKHSIDLIFLDINMPGLNGIELIKSLEQPPMVVITTAYREHAVEGFELNVFDYLIKPISLPRFVKTADKVMEHFQILKRALGIQKPPDSDYLFIKVDKKIVKIFLSDILYVESLKDYVRIFTEAENFITHQNLGNFTASLPPDQFLRIHRSFTIALDKIKALVGNDVEIGNKKIPIGRNYQQDIRKRILQYT